MAETSIEWTDATWSPVAGCTVLTAGCTNCYAMRMAARLDAMGQAKYKGLTRRSGGRSVWTGKVRLDSKSLEAPKAWSKPRKVFVNSMSDLFQDKADEKFIRQVWQVMARAHWHSFQILTKRPERMLNVLSNPEFPRLPNVWLGTSVESEDYVHRIDVLRQVPARVRFISFEPLLAPIRDPNLAGIHWAMAASRGRARGRCRRSGSRTCVIRASASASRFSSSNGAVRGRKRQGGCC